jgi:hypothetical protein
LIHREKSPCNGLSFHTLVSSIVIKIKILLIDKILDHFVRHPVFQYIKLLQLFYNKVFF